MTERGIYYGLFTIQLLSIKSTLVPKSWFYKYVK